jgi:hypothetical protein
MAKSTDVQSLIDQFVTDLSTLMRRSALEQVLAVMEGGAAPAPRGPGRPRKVTVVRMGKMSGGGKRSPEEMERMTGTLLDYVKSNPGSRGEQIAVALGTDVKTMRLPMLKLIADKQVRTEGQRRGMTYFAGAGGGSSGAGNGRKAKKSGRRRGKKKAG